MASDIGTVRVNVRFQIRDRDSEEYLVSDDEINRMIVRKSQEMTGVAIPGEAWSVGALVLNAGSYETTFSGSTQYDSVQHIREQTKGYLMQRWSRTMMEETRQGPTLAVGYPRAYYLIESSASVTTVRFYPKADIQYTFDVLLSGIPSGTVTDATVVPYSDLVVAAIEKAVACECVAKVSPDRLAGRGLSPGVIQVWESDVQRLLGAEVKRASKLKRNPFLYPMVR